MKKFAKLGVWLGLCAALAGCGDADTPNPSKNTSDAAGGAPGAAGNAGTGAYAGAAGDPSSANPCGAVDTSLADRDAAQLFATPAIPKFDLTLPAAAWEELKIHARDEQYVEAQACFDGRAIGRVGMRFKGSYGSLFNCFDASGVNTCRKLGMKVKFDEYDPGQRFFGLKRLNFHGYHYDDSYLKERLSYELYSAMDVIAPRAAWAVLRVNGESQGLFGMVEEVDGRFAKSRWPDNGDANLYKELWPGQTNDSWILSHLQTNEQLADIAAFKAFSTAIHGASPGQLREILGSYVDLGYWARYMAVDDAIANFDGITTYYTSGAADESGNHNFYIYEESPQRYTIVPWDLEATLNLSSGFGSVPQWQKTPTDCSVTYPAWTDGKLRVMAPGCDPVFQALAGDLTQYHAEASRLLDGPFAEATMLAKIDAFASFIRAEAEADPHGPGATGFENAVGYLRQEIPRLRRRLEFIQTGQTSIPLQIVLGEVMTFEANDNYGLTVGTMLMSNSNSKASVELDSTTPLNGTKSLRFLFNYANETAPWGQWSIYHVPLAEGPKDVRTLTGIRFKARTNQSRQLRFDLISPSEDAAANLKGIHFGWDLNVTTEALPFEVLFANAAIPSWAADPGEKLSVILASLSSLSYQPICNSRMATGQLPDGTSDNGWIEVDDIEVF